jgi:hypothetical protein
LQTVEDVNDLNDVDMLFKTVIQKSAMQFAEKEWKEFEKVEKSCWSCANAVIIKLFHFFYQTESSSDSSQINSSAHSDQTLCNHCVLENNVRNKINSFASQSLTMSMFLNVSLLFIKLRVAQLVVQLLVNSFNKTSKMTTRHSATVAH